jgi:hypothetical protein
MGNFISKIRLEANGASAYRERMMYSGWENYNQLPEGEDVK